MNSMSELALSMDAEQCTKCQGIFPQTVNVIPLQSQSCALQALGDISPRTCTNIFPSTRPCVCLLRGDASPFCCACSSTLYNHCACGRSSARPLGPDLCAHVSADGSPPGHALNGTGPRALRQYAVPGHASHISPRSARPPQLLPCLHAFHTGNAPGFHRVPAWIYAPQVGMH